MKFRTKRRFNKKKRFGKKKVTKVFKKYVKKVVNKFTPTTTVNYGSDLTYTSAAGAYAVSASKINNLLTAGDQDYSNSAADVGARTGFKVSVLNFRMKSWVNFNPMSDADNTVAYRYFLITNPPNSTSITLVNGLVRDASTYFTEPTHPAYFGNQLTTGNPYFLLTADVDDRWVKVIYEKVGLVNSAPNSTRGNYLSSFYKKTPRFPKTMTFIDPATNILQTGTVWHVTAFVGTAVTARNFPVHIVKRFFMQFKSIQTPQFMN